GVGVLKTMHLTDKRWTPGREMHDPGACRITHGPNDSYFPNLAGRPVALVRRCLAGVFSITDEAEPWVGGFVVSAEYRLQGGDWLEFLVRRGQKGATKFRTILADPAWPYRSPRAVVGNGGRGNPHGHAKDIIQVDASAHYPLMTLEAIKALPVEEV